MARPKKNTENFSPCHEPPPMRVIVATPGLTRYGPITYQYSGQSEASIHLTNKKPLFRYDRAHTTRDVIIVSDLFGPPGDLGIYNKLIQEIQVNTGLLLVHNKGL